MSLRLNAWHVHCTEHSVALRAAAGFVADACAFQPLSSSVALSPFQPLFPEPHAIVAVPASPVVLFL